MVRARLAWREPMMSTPEREQFSTIERIERSLLLLAYFIELDGEVHVPIYQESPKRVGMTFTAVGVPLDPIDQACFLNSSTRTRVFSL
jgi:hypothetical protein